MLISLVRSVVFYLQMIVLDTQIDGYTMAGTRLLVMVAGDELGSILRYEDVLPSPGAQWR